MKVTKPLYFNHFTVLSASLPWAPRVSSYDEFNSRELRRSLSPLSKLIAQHEWLSLTRIIPKCLITFMNQPGYLKPKNSHLLLVSSKAGGQRK